MTVSSIKRLQQLTRSLAGSSLFPSTPANFRKLAKNRKNPQNFPRHNQSIKKSTHAPSTKKDKNFRKNFGENWRYMGVEVVVHGTDTEPRWNHFTVPPPPPQNPVPTCLCGFAGPETKRLVIDYPWLSVRGWGPWARFLPQMAHDT